MSENCFSPPQPNLWEFRYIAIKQVVLNTHITVTRSAVFIDGKFFEQGFEIFLAET